MAGQNKFCTFEDCYPLQRAVTTARSMYSVLCALNLALKDEPLEAYLETIHDALEEFREVG